MNQQNKQGRLDLAILAFGEAMSGKFKAQSGVDIWENGGRELAEELIRHWGIPNQPINIPMTIARNVGLLPDKPSRLRRVG